MRKKRFRPILIATKLNRLEMTSGRWVPRPRLVTRLEENLAKRVTLISAPAGYGKSTLAAQWLEQSHLPSAWLSLDKYDNNVEYFLRYVIAAVRTIVPEFGFDIEHLLLSAQLPPPDYLADIMISDLAEIDKPLLLVLDDYHTIESKAVQAVVIRMVQHQSDGMHLIITTRVDPPWPLALWRSREWLNEIRASDLLFSKDEMQAFFAHL